jgi:AraC-like DNA-binding protein
MYENQQETRPFAVSLRDGAWSRRFRRGQRDWKPGVFRDLLISYLFVLIVPLAFGLFIYQQSISIITENVQNENLMMLERTRDVFDINLKNAQMILTQISLNQNVMDFMYNQNGESNDIIYRLYEINTSLASYNHFDDFIFTYFVMFQDCDYVVIKGEVHTTRSFFDNYFSLEGRDSFKEWLEGQYRKSPYMGFYKAQNIVVKGSPKRVYEYSVSLPYASLRKTLGSIHVLIDEQDIKKMMERSGTQMFSYIADAHGNPVSFFSDKYVSLPKTHMLVTGGEMSGHFIEKTENGKNIVYFTHSSDGQWVFVVAQSLEEILGKVNKTRNLFLLVLFLSVFLAMVISMLLSYRKARPLVNMLNNLAEYSGLPNKPERGELYYLQKSVMTLIRENNAIRYEIDRQQPILRNVFLTRLLRGEVADKEEIKMNFSRMHIDIEAKHFIVILGRFEEIETESDPDPFTGSQTLKAVLTDTMNLQPSKIPFLEVDLDERVIAYIGISSINDNSEYTRYCRDFFSKIRDKLSTQYIINVHFAFGIPVGDVSQMYYSFDTAKYTQENSLLRGYSAGISVFDPDTKRQGRYDYSMAVEMRLINFAREGNIEEIKSSLNHIFEGRGINNNDNNSLKLLLAVLKNTLFRLNSIMFSNEPEIYHQLDTAILAIEHFDQADIIAAFEAICSARQKTRKNTEADFKESLLRYIHENYRRNDFYLGSVTCHFKLSETYLSLFFKECTGENFISYVEKLRLQDACDFLKNVSLPIETIASSVGYSSSHVFRRAFKRRYGVSPTEYRNYGKM